jgi:hypothetical protein
MDDQRAADACRELLSVLEKTAEAYSKPGYQAIKLASSLYEALRLRAAALVEFAAARGVDPMPFSAIPSRPAESIRAPTVDEEAAMRVLKKCASELLKSLIDARGAPASSPALRSALNWLQAELLATDRPSVCVPRDEFHGYLLSIHAPVNEVVAACKGRGWIVDAEAYVPMLESGSTPPYSSSIRYSRNQGPLVAVPGYRIQPAARSAIVPTLASESELHIDRSPQIEQPGAQSPRRANTAKLFPNGVPPNSDIVDLVVRLDAAKGSGRSDLSVAREFFGECVGNDPKSKSHLSQIRRMRRKGRITL